MKIKKLQVTQIVTCQNRIGCQVYFRYVKESATAVTNRQILVSQKEDAASAALATERHQYIGPLANTGKSKGKYQEKARKNIGMTKYQVKFSDKYYENCIC